MRAFDLSPGMVEQARAHVPGLEVEVLDLHRLLRPRTDDGWGAVLSWYSLIHLAPSELPAAVGALARVLRPGGWLVLALHAGPGLRHSDEWLGAAVDLDGVWHDPGLVCQVVEGTGLTVDEWYLRGPLGERGETTDRFYLVAHV